MESPENETASLTVGVTWWVWKGRKKGVRAWRHEIAAVLEFPGHRGVNRMLPRSTEGEKNDYPERSD